MSDGSTSTGGPKRPRRRPRRRGKRRTEQAKKPPATAVDESLAESRIDASRPADEPLSEQEITEMRMHLRFLRRHRKELRLKVNAAEDPGVRASCMEFVLAGLYATDRISRAQRHGRIVYEVPA